MGAVAILEKDVVQANPLIEARKEMNVTEMRLFVLGLQDIKPHIKDDTLHDVEFHETIIPYNELIELFGNDYNGNITNLKKQVKKASRCVIELSSDNGGFGFSSIYRKIKYEPGKGLIIHFNDELKPYILELVNQAYTRYKIKAFFSLSSSYSWRILEALLEKQGYLRQGHKEIFIDLTMEKVRFLLNVEKGKYEGRINNFRKYILDNPIKEINEKTDYLVWYEVQKTGRKVTGFKFWLKLKEKAENLEAIESNHSPERELPAPVLPAATSSDKEALIAAMLAEGMPKSGIHTWLKSYGVEGASASWQLAVEHAGNRTETQGKGTQRKKYLKACMERNIAAINDDEARLKAEIDAREKRAAEEKKQAMQAMQEGFEKIGFTSRREGSGLQSMGSLLGVQEKPPETAEPQELTGSQLRTIVELWRESGNHFTDSLLQTLKRYGYTENTIMRRYWRCFIEAPASHAGDEL